MKPEGRLSVVFRADASAAIGGGHVMRCLALADALREAGARCWFAGVAQTKLTVPALATPNHGWIEIAAPGDAKALDRGISEPLQGQCDWLVVDHYGWDATEESQCRSWARNILVIDDLADRTHDCDVLLDQTFRRAASDYHGLVAGSCRMLTGASYALLRPEFAAARTASLTRRSSGKVSRVLVSMGLTDPSNATARVVEEIIRSALPLQVDVVLGAAAPHLVDVKRQAQNSAGAIKVHAGTNAMADFMTKADLAIGAAGSTSWERCCVGLPSLMLVVADNQEEIAERLDAAQAAISLGTIEELADGRIAELLRDLAQAPAKLLEMARSAAAICDGRGVQRAAMHLKPETARDGKPVWLLPATPDDCDLVHRWQSEPEARKFMRSPAVPPLDEHRQWFLARLGDPNCLFCIVVCDGIASGSLRLDRTDTGSFEISIVIGSAFQGQGIAVAALALARRLVPEAGLEAEVIAGNIRSEALFTRAGFSPKGYGLRRLPALHDAGAAAVSVV